MATFRSVHSEPYTSKNSSSSSRLTALRKRLTTCFQQWCQQLQQPPSYRKSGPNHFYKIFVQADYKVFGEKAKYIRQFKKIFKGNKDLARKREPERVVVVPETETETVPAQSVDVTEVIERKQLELVARLFSSTLISTQEEISCSYKSSSSSMTIIESNYIGVREEYPEIDSEIRSILLANAQSGITISSIKNEYRKLTGNPFPLHENVTDFLLTIPHVTAECSVTGKRIFNMKPRPETRHLYEMVVNQKRSNDLVSQDHPEAARPPRFWRYQYKRRALSSLDTNKSHNRNINHIEEKLSTVDSKECTLQAQVGPLQQLARAAAESNWCYQDNWNHLNNCYRRTNIFTAPPEKPPPLPAQENQHPHISQNKQENPKNHQENLKNQLNLLVSEQHQQQESRTSNKRRNDFSPTPTPTTISSGTQHDSMFTINSDYDAYLLDFPLLGDDFLLYMARMELRCRFKRSVRVLQSGLCVSGQTISAARSRLHRVQMFKDTHVIVNIGSVDIMRGKPIVQIQHDFRQLIKDMHKRGLTPILTTLAPLANYCHDKVVCDKVAKFNLFIWKECASYLKVIDIHSCLVNEKGVVRFDCFQYLSRNVTGSRESYVFWNKIGRQRVLQMIEASLEY
ncbi:maternal effect protein oskar [Drosophila guanche]|uniref:Blast:Maternal effect protein oskar n=1 Tax=Drosophila guanche TaxID=7266 RepID=A0A3B0KKW4_DROGU|nr:maternal effect protein oskar [Drosophila guanche]SPP84428.1 blast:Maternal effect protein oskar [Drosophila guanche]